MDPGPHRDPKHRTKLFPLAVIALFKVLPKPVEAQVMGRRSPGACTSVGANARAAFRGHSERECIAKPGIVIEEADECASRLEVLTESGTMPPSYTDALPKGSHELVSIPTSLVTR